MADKLANSLDLVSIEEIRDSTIVLKDASMRQILMVQGLNFSLKSEEEQNMITSAYQNFLNSVDFGIQIVIHSRKINVQKYLDDLEKRIQAEPSPLLQNQITEYKEFVHKFVQENAIMEKSFLVVVPWYPSIVGGGANPLDALPFFKKKKDAAQAAAQTEETFRQNILQLKQRVDQITQGLTAIGLESIVLSDQELTELLYNLYNPESIEKEGLTLPTNA